jgi:hypothetical protein
MMDIEVVEHQVDGLGWRDLTNHRWWQKYSSKFKALPEVIYV